MDPEKDIKRRRKRKLIGEVMDAFFDPDIVFSGTLVAKAAMWLLDPEDWDLKDGEMRRKFDEIMADDSIGMADANVYAGIMSDMEA